ncbi:MAG: discoidin domain-containing protein [Phycisphaerae bacterium]
MDRGSGTAPCGGARRGGATPGALTYVLFAAFAGGAAGQPRVLDNFDSLDSWRVTSSEGVDAAIVAGEGSDGAGLRLDYHFRSGAGFCVVRREFSVALDENYRFAFDLRGVAPANNLEFKLVDESGENVWWENRRAYEPPREWRTLVTPRRRLQFAWGPSGGAPLRKISAIEFAVASASGGHGSLWIDRLTYQPLPASTTEDAAPRVTFWSGGGADRTLDLPTSGAIRWRWADSAGSGLRVDLGRVREVGGLAIQWTAERGATAYEIALSEDGQSWEDAARVEHGDGGGDYIALPDAHARHIRLVMTDAHPPGAVELCRLRVLPPEFAESPNTMWRTIAADAPRGRYPRYLLGEQVMWTVAGVPGDSAEALLDTDGAIEVDRGAFRIEPFLRIGDTLVTWADVETQPALAHNDLPIPSVTWSRTRAADTPPGQRGVSLQVTALVDGPAGAAVLRPAYRIANTSDVEREGALLLAVRPFQILPPWHELNLVGGAARINSLNWDGNTLTVNGRHAISASPAPSAVAARGFADGDVAADRAERAPSTPPAVEDPRGFASALLRFDFRLAPGGETRVVLTVPFCYAATAGHSAQPPQPASPTTAEQWQEAHERVAEQWSRELNRVGLHLPPSAARLARTFRTVQGHILINADGPRIQPGSRTYERSWIRDGALTSTALLYTGHAGPVREFLDWYAPHQFESGKVPCVVDRRGPDPVPEHDSTGQLIYALRKYYQFTRDRAFLERHLPRVVRGVDYIEALRGERMTREYLEGPAEQRAKFGLVPESISHEGYSAKPMHSYWDNFFVLRGLADAAAIASVLERPELVDRFERLRDDYRRCLGESLRIAMEARRIDFIPGCVELGDFDATSTAIALFPCEARGVLSAPAVAATFDRYYQYFGDRRDGRLEWTNYTPYEVRLIGTFLRLDQPARAHALLDFFLAGQRPREWNQWGEVVWHDATFPGFVGDMPHTWVGSDFLSAARSLFVHERESDDALVLAAGVRAPWLEGPEAAEGVAVRAFPTTYGLVSYTLRRTGDALRIDLETAFDPAPSAVIIHNPTSRAIAHVNANGDAIQTFTNRAVVLNKIGARTSVVVSLGGD